MSAIDGPQPHFPCRRPDQMSHFVIRTPGDLVRILVEYDLRIPVNLFDAAGHIFYELDNFMRMRHLGDAPPCRGYLMCMPESPMARATGEMFGDFFFGLSVNSMMFEIFREVAHYYPELTLDIGLSHLKISMPENRSFRRLPHLNHVYYMTDHATTLKGQADHYRRIARSPDYHPLAKDFPLPAALADAIGPGTAKMALIQLKTMSINATPQATQAESYLPALDYLQDMGYQLIFAGREVMPDVFRRYNILNYSQSQFATFQNDVALFRNAAFALTAASGIANLADRFGVPVVYSNMWHMPLPIYSGRCVVVPTLLQDAASGRLLGFAEQFNEFLSAPDFRFWSFPSDRYAPRVADGADILAAVQEAVGLGSTPRPRSPEQEALRALGGEQCLGVAESRFSQAFLERFCDLMPR